MQPSLLSVISGTPRKAKKVISSPSLKRAPSYQRPPLLLARSANVKSPFDAQSALTKHIVYMTVHVICFVVLSEFPLSGRRLLFGAERVLRVNDVTLKDNKSDVLSLTGS